MIYLIIVWTVLSFVCFSIGLALLKAFKANCFERRGDRFIVAVWIGIATLCFSLLSVSLFVPLSAWVGGAIAVGLVVLSLLSRSTRTEIVRFWSRISPMEGFGFFVLALAIAALSAKPVTWIDTGLYHYGAIQWLGEYGAVPGVALIHDRFAFTSSWFALAAPFDASWLGSRNSTLTNGFVFFLACFHLTISLNYAYQKRGKFSDLFNISWSVIILLILLFYGWMSEVRVSPSPDIPIHLATGVIPWSILVISGEERKNFDSLFNAWLVPLLLSAIAVTIKLMALPLLIVTYFNYLFQGRLKISKLLLGSFVAFFLLLPMFIFGVIASGCPLYPKTIMCFDLPWLVPAQEAAKTAAITQRWGDWTGESPSDKQDWLWIGKQLWIWLKNSKINQLMAFSVAISIFFSAIILNKTDKKEDYNGYFLVIAIGIIGMLFIITQAPSIRLGLGYFLLIPALFITVVTYRLSQNQFSWFSNLGSSFLFSKVALFFSIFLISLGLFVLRGQTQNYLLLPPELKKTQLTSDRINDLQYFYPKNYKSEVCWAAKLPCALGPIKQDIQLRDPEKGIGGGFVFVNAVGKRH